MNGFLKHALLKMFKQKTQIAESDDEICITSEAMSKADKIIREIGNSIYDDAFSLARKEGRIRVDVADIDAVAKKIIELLRKQETEQ